MNNQESYNQVSIIINGVRYDTLEEAKAVKAGDYIDIEKTKVTFNTTTPVKP